MSCNHCGFEACCCTGPAGPPGIPGPRGATGPLPPGGSPGDVLTRIDPEGADWRLPPAAFDVDNIPANMYASRPVPFQSTIDPAFGGELNLAAESATSEMFSSAIGGRGHTVTGARAAIVAGGEANVVSSGAWTGILGGSGNVAPMFGSGGGAIGSTDALIRRGGALVHAIGKINVPGDNQYTPAYIVKGESVSGAPVVLVGNGGEAFPFTSLPRQSCYHIEALALAQRSDGAGDECAAWFNRFLARIVAGSAVILSNPGPVVMDPLATGWTLAYEDVVSNSIVPRFTGAVGMNVYCEVVFRFLEFGLGTVP